MRAPKRRSIAIFVVIGALILLIFLDTQGFLGGIKNMGYRVVHPFVVVTNRVTKTVFETALLPFFYDSLLRENEQLIEDRSLLLEKLSRFTEIERENQVLREALDIGKQEGFKLVFARILYKDILVPGGHFLIDVGRNEGIEEGMIVISSSSSFIGSVAEAERDYSRILLLTDSSSILSVLTQSSRILGSVQGSLGTSLTFYTEGLEKDLEDGELLITSGFDKGVPRGLRVGEMRDTEETSDKTGTRSSVSLPFSLSNIEKVFVITNASTPFSTR